jgi:TRAP-type mannitol/chloroaromatic compound transport system permease large subunit
MPQQLCVSGAEIVNVVVASTVKTYAAILLWIFTSLVFSVYTSALSGLRWTSWILCQLRTLPLQRFGFLTLAASYRLSEIKFP